MKKTVLFAILLGAFVASFADTGGLASRIRTGSTVPATCSAGDFFIKTGSTPGPYWCSATNTWTVLASSTTPIYDVGVFIPTLTAAKANANLLIPRAWTLPASLTLSLCGIKTDGTNPSGSIVVSLRKNTTEFGTATVATDGTCVLASASGATFNGTSDYYSIVMPADTKGAAGLSITLAGTR